MESKGMQFARQMMQKMGWKEGNGLGINQHGITEAIRPSGKFNVTGLGHKTYNDFHWWDHAFNKAAQAFEINVSDNQGPVVEKVNTVGKIKTKKESSSKSENLAYGTFHKTGTLSNGIEESTSSSIPSVPEEDFSVKLSDEELFRVCGGRTAHKGARHGLTASGKLARIAQQEAELLEQLNRSEKKSDQSGKKKAKSNPPTDETPSVQPELCPESESRSDSLESSAPKKSKKSKRKRQSDCEIDLEDQASGSIIDQECSGKNESILKKKKKKSKRDCQDS